MLDFARLSQTFADIILLIKSVILYRIQYFKQQNLQDRSLNTTHLSFAQLLILNMKYFVW